MTVDQHLPTPAEWDAFVGAHPRAHVLQQWAWGDLKAAFGWQADRIALRSDDGHIGAAAQLLFRRLPFHLGTMAYLAMGPLISDKWQATSGNLESDLEKAIDQSVHKHRAAFLKWEP